jgi:general secretion pathway protein G
VIVSNVLKRTVGFALVVSILLGVLVYLRGITIVDTKEVRAQQELLLIKTALKKFREEHGRYPTETEGLQVLIDPSPQGKYFVSDRVLKDPWGHSVVYQVSPQGDGFVIYSLGPNGIDKGDHDDNIIVRNQGILGDIQ